VNQNVPGCFLTVCLLRFSIGSERFNEVLVSMLFMNERLATSRSGEIGKVLGSWL